MCFSLHNEWCVASEYKCVSVFIMNGVLASEYKCVSVFIVNGV